MVIRSVCRSIARSLARTQSRIGLWRAIGSRSVRVGGEWYNFARRYQQILGAAANGAYDDALPRGRSTMRSRIVDFTFNDEQQMVQKMCREFAEEEIKPRAEEMDRSGEFPYEIVRKMAELGLLGLPFPEEYGGAGADYLTYCLALEEIGRGDASVGITMEAHTSLGATRAAVVVRADGARRGVGLWQFGDARREIEGDVDDQRREELHHQRWHGDVWWRHDHGGDRCASGRAQGDQQLHRAEGDERLL